MAERVTSGFGGANHQHTDNFAADRTVENEEKVARIVDLRRQRVKWADIAKAVGVNRARTIELYNRALAEIPAPHVDEHRVEETMLIDDAIEDLLKIARDGRNVSARSRIEAWNSIRGWAERKAKLLGLDAPQQVVTLDKVDQEIAALTKELQALELTQ